MALSRSVLYAGQWNRPFSPMRLVETPASFRFFSREAEHSSVTVMVALFSSYLTERNVSYTKRVRLGQHSMLCRSSKRGGLGLRFETP